MGKINLYNSLDASFQTINGCGKLSDLLPTVDFNHAVILKAGNRLTGDYEVTPEDVLFVRKTPSGLDPMTWIVIGVTLGASLLGAGAGYLLLRHKSKKDQEKAQRDAQNLASQINQLPFIKGAQNRSALGYTIPYVIGDVYHTPYKMTDGYYSIANGSEASDFGTKQYYNVVLNLGYGAQQIKEILIGDNSVLKNNSGITEGIKDFDENSVFYDPENKIEICQPGTEFTAPYFGTKVICNQDGAELKHEFEDEAEPVIRTLPEYTKTVEVCIQFNGLRKYNSDKSKWEKLKNKIVPYWTNVENPVDTDWQPFYFDGMTNNEIELNTNHTIRFVARKTFTGSEAYGKQIKIKLVKETRAEKSNSNEACYLAYYQSFCYDNKLSSVSNLVDCSTVDEYLADKTSRIGIRLIANDNTSDNLNEIHALVCGLAKTWNGTEWSTSKSPTRNPASWLLEVMTSPAHKHSQYAESEFELDSLGALYKHCADNNLFVDGILTDPIKKNDLITQILDSCSAVMFINADGKWEVRIDQKEDVPVALLNSESISEISYSKDLTRKTDGYKVTFTNRESWQVDTFYVKKDGTPRTADDTFGELNLSFVTTYDHAYKIALKALKQEELQPKEITVDVGRDGDYYPLFSTVMLQYTTFRTGLNSSVIAGLITINGNITGIKLSDSVTMEAGKNYGVIIQAVNDNGKKHFYKSVVNSATTNILTFNTAISNSEEILPAIGDTVSFGELDADNQFTKITDVMKITGIAPNESYGYKLTLKNYNPAIYETGAIPEFKSNITTPPKPVKEIPNFEKLEGSPGENGYSSYTLQLFKRYSGMPDLPSGQIKYTFNPPSLSGDLEGWQQSMPEVDEDNNPLYETHVTIINQNNEVILTAADFSEPVIVLKDSNITIAEIQEMINKVTPPPSVDADVTFFGIAVNENGIATKSQSVTTEIHVRQVEEELGFEFDTIDLPDGYKYEITGNKITIICEAGTYVKSGSFIIPVKYRAYKANIAYVNNNDATDYYIGSGNVLGNFDDISQIPTSPAEKSIINWIGEDTPMSRAADDMFINNTAYQFVSGTWKKFDFTPYGYYVYESDYSITNIGIGFTQVKGFRYFDSITNINDIPADVILGDWFTWNGEDTESSLVEGGIFKQCCIYAWDGDKWAIDNSTDHNTRAIFDILKLAESKLSENNSTAQDFLDRLCANKAFIQTLVVSGSAFIRELTSLNIYAEQITVAKNTAIDDSLKQLVGAENVQNHTIIDGGKIKTDLIEASELVIGDSTLDNVLNDKAEKMDIPTKVSELNNDSNFTTMQNVESEIGLDSITGSDKTIIKGGKIDTNFIEAESIDAEKIDVQSLKVTEGFFDDVTATRGTYNEITTNKARLKNTLISLSSSIRFAANESATTERIWNSAQNIINNLINNFNIIPPGKTSYSGYINGSCRIEFSSITSSNATLSIDFTNASTMFVDVSNNNFDLEIYSVLGVRSDKTKPELFDIYFRSSPTEWSFIIQSKSTLVDLPDTSSQAPKSYNFYLGFIF